MRLILGVLVALFGAWAPAAAADFFVFQGRTYTLEEMAEPGTRGDDQFWSALRATRKKLSGELPAALGRACMITPSQEELAAYVAWWNRQVAAEVSDLERGLSGDGPPKAQVSADQVRTVKVSRHDPERVRVRLAKLKSAPPLSAADPEVRNRALQAVTEQKQMNCLMEAFPRAPFGESPRFSSGPMPLTEVAPLSLEGTPVHACLSAPPNGSLWDAIKEAEERGVLTFRHKRLAMGLSARTRKRPAGQAYAAPEPCWSSPPWSASPGR